MKVKITFRYYVKDDGKVYGRLIAARKKAELYTGVQIHAGSWNALLQRSGQEQTDQRLSEIRVQIENIIKGLEKQNRSLRASTVIELYRQGSKAEEQLVAYYESALQAKVCSAQLHASYRLTLNYLKGFLSLKDNISYPLKGLDYVFLRDFDSYLTRNRSMGRNTANKHHSRLRSMLLQAQREGLLTRNPYQEYPLKGIAGRRSCLTMREVERLAEADLESAPLQAVRDLFLFSVYTGLRYSDAMRLRAEHIEVHAGVSLFRIEQQKTSEPLCIRLLAPALEILARQAGHQKITGRLFAQISNQQVNRYLKQLAALVGIRKRLTHHVARHTCATTILLENGVPLEAVSKWLGHRKITTTQIYARMTDSYLLRLGRELDEKLKAA